MLDACAQFADNRAVGYRARWLAVKNADLEAVLRTVGLRQESETREPIYDTGFYAANLPGGWLVVIGDGWDHMDAVQPAHAQALSIGAEAFHFYCDDSEMCASLGAYRDGKEVWFVEHDGSNGPRPPTVTGAPPAIVSGIVARLKRQQGESGDKNVDYLYEACPEIALALTGFRHDRTLSEGELKQIFVLAVAG